MKNFLLSFILASFLFLTIAPTTSEAALTNLATGGCTVGEKISVQVLKRGSDGKVILDSEKNPKYETKTINRKGVATLDCIPIIFGNVVYWALAFSGAVAVILIIIGGLKLTTSAGDPQKVEGAKKTIVWSIIGLILILLSFAIVAIIAQLTGVGCITKFGFTQCVPKSANYCSNEHRSGYCPEGKRCARTNAQVYKCVECDADNGRRDSECPRDKQVCQNWNCVKCTKAGHCGADATRWKCTDNKCVKRTKF